MATDRVHSGKCGLTAAAGLSCKRGGAPLSVCPPPSSVSSFCGLVGWFADRQVDRGGPLAGDGGQVGGGGVGG